MYNLIKNPPLIRRLVNKQFEMIGENVQIQDIENGVTIKDGKKEKIVPWWHVYFFDNEEQYDNWKEWVIKELVNAIEHSHVRELQDEINFLDLLYGMNVRQKKKGELL